MIWWLIFEKKPFQFWREIWIQVIVILLQLYCTFVLWLVDRGAIFGRPFLNLDFLFNNLLQLFCSVFNMNIVYLLNYKQKEKIKSTSKRIRKQQPNKIKSHHKLRIRKSCIFNSSDWFIIQCKWDKWFKPNFGMKLSN